ncbi:sigma-54-dependent transcriptional regulator [Planctomicrobium sp. SH668]|uniref:sigma-54-dependent transcriptional regulator n=1 Tax=Planctomicrobium sp. SH668 TaxID=3448126 RepID=UPI003F5C0CEA
MPSLCILIADDEAPARFGMRRALQLEGALIIEAEDGQQALEMIQAHQPDLVFLDLNMPQLDGKGLLRALGPQVRNQELIVVTANNSIAEAVECVRLGAADFIAKPYEVEQIRSIARRVKDRLQLEQEVADLQRQLDERNASGAILGLSRPMRLLIQQMGKIAKFPVDVLIRGESGTGKELVARELHRMGPRPDGPFVAVNTAAIPETLTESELFGHRKGAFTGADRDHVGVFEQANGGTLFLDEIGDMPLAAQTKILRALQERVIQPIGSTKSQRVDVRVISATHQNLDEAIAAGEFRQDLYYRLKGIELQLPPLRLRREDILLLANSFLERAGRLTGNEMKEFSQNAIEALLSHPWPGNVRELEHAVLSACAMSEDDQIHSHDLGINPARTDSEEGKFDRYLMFPLSVAKSMLTEDFERMAITLALNQEKGNVSAASRRLGMHRQSLQQKMTQLGLARPDKADPQVQ